MNTMKILLAVLAVFILGCVIFFMYKQNITDDYIAETYETEPAPTPTPTPEPAPEPIIEIIPLPEPTPTPFTPTFTSEPIPPHIKELITGVSFHDHAPFDYCFLAYLTITHVDFNGEYQKGNMIVAAEIGEEVLDIFQEIFQHRFPIYSMRLIDFYDASDYLSMAANNSVAFNFRTIAGTDRLSRHAFGKAIDINPIQNPYIRGDTIWPAAGAEYLNREYIRPGMITKGCPVYTAFTSRGWRWGGDWRSPRDYHHFER